MVRICFVCLGNICRSPTAEGVMRQLVRQAALQAHIEIDSAGTAAHHAGEPADSRARRAAARRGVTLSGRARQFTRDDWEAFDYILAMDTENLAALKHRAPSAAALKKLKLLRDFDPASQTGSSVPDPYYGGAGGFEEVLDLCQAACRALLVHLESTGTVG